MTHYSPKSSIDVSICGQRSFYTVGTTPIGTLKNIDHPLMISAALNKPTTITIFNTGNVLDQTKNVMFCRSIGFKTIHYHTIENGSDSKIKIRHAINVYNRKQYSNDVNNMN